MKIYNEEYENVIPTVNLIVARGELAAAIEQLKAVSESIRNIFELLIPEIAKAQKENSGVEDKEMPAEIPNICDECDVEDCELRCEGNEVPKDPTKQDSQAELAVDMLKAVFGAIFGEDAVAE